jgi:hypothetical protein
MRYRGTPKSWQKASSYHLSFIAIECRWLDRVHHMKLQL